MAHPCSRLCKAVGRAVWDWLLGRRPLDLGVMPLTNKHVRLLVFLGELRAKRDGGSAVTIHAWKYGDRVIEERERRLAEMHKRASLRVLRGGRHGGHYVG